MPNANKVILIGHLTRDVQTKFLPNQTMVAEFGIATSRKYTTGAGEKKEETCFVDCVCFGKPAETLAQYTAKGKPLYVEGRLKFDSWDDKQTGAKRSKLSVIVEQFQFLSSGDGGQAQTPQRQRQPVKTADRQVEKPWSDDGETMDPDSIPF